MSFTQIESDTVVTIPQIEAKTFDKKWLSHIRINSTPQKASVIAHLLPYDGTETLKEPVENVFIENIFAEMQNEDKPIELRTLYAQTMELILQTIKAQMAWDKSQIEVIEEDI
jgi:hypothetical protein